MWVTGSGCDSGQFVDHGHVGGKLHDGAGDGGRDAGWQVSEGLNGGIGAGKDIRFCEDPPADVCQYKDGCQSNRPSDG